MSPDCAQDDNNGVSVTVYCWVTKLPRIELSIFLYERWKSVGILNVYSTSVKAYSVRFLKLMNYICCVWVLCLYVWSYRYSSTAIIFGIQGPCRFGLYQCATSPIIKFTENLYLTIGASLNPSSCPAPLCDPTDKGY